MTPRAIRRAAEHKARKAANKAALREPNVVEIPASTETAELGFPEPGLPLPLFSEITPARLAANRQNASKSTGPKSVEGKATSSQNRTTHGLARHNGAFALLPTEDSAEFAYLLNGFAEEHQPTTLTEATLVSDIAESLWLRNRAQRLQSNCFDPATGHVADTKSFALYMRYESTHQRAFHKSLNQLLKLRAERRKSELGFEAQQHKQQAELRAQEQHQMKKDAHYWSVLKKDAEACHQIGLNAIQKLDAIQQHPGFLTEFTAGLENHNVKQGSFSVAVAA